MSDWSQAVSAHKGEAKSGATMSGSRGLQEEEPLLFEQTCPAGAASICRSRPL